MRGEKSSFLALLDLCQLTVLLPAGFRRLLNANKTAIVWDQVAPPDEKSVLPYSSLPDFNDKRSAEVSFSLSHRRTPFIDNPLTPSLLVAEQIGCFETEWRSWYYYGLCWT